MSSQIRASRSSTRILFPPISPTPPKKESFATARLVSAVNPRAAPRSRPEPLSSTGSSGGAVPRIRLEETRLDRLGRGHEERLDPACLRLDQEVREDPEDLAVLSHDGLAAEFRRKNLHSRRGAYPRVLIFPFWPRRP